MTSPTPFSRRQMLKSVIGAAAGVIALDRVADAFDSSAFLGAAGPLQNSELRPAERIPPTTTTTTVPPPPDGQIAFPVDPGDACWISDNFGDCRGSSCSRSHEGLDIMSWRGAEIYAVVRGRLTKKYVGTPGATGGAGNGWTLYDDTTDTTYKYFHMDAHAPGLEVGSTVEFGDVLGWVGNTGTTGANSNTNYHLHFEYRPHGVATDPRPLLVRPSACTFYDG